MDWADKAAKRVADKHEATYDVRAGCYFGPCMEEFIAIALRAEREACAKIADAIFDTLGPLGKESCGVVAIAIAAAIRKPS